MLPWSRTFAARAFERAMGDNLRNIAELIEPATEPLLDIGCDDGERTRLFADAADEVHGIDLVEERAQLARASGIEVQPADVDQGLPYEDGRFATVFSNQVGSRFR